MNDERITITIGIDESTIRGAATKAALEALTALFAASKYDRRDQGGAGYEAVLKQTLEVISTLDFRDVIQAEARKLVDGIVRDLVGQELRRKVKAALKSELEDGTLFGDKS